LQLTVCFDVQMTADLTPDTLRRTCTCHPA